MIEPFLFLSRRKLLLAGLAAGSTLASGAHAQGFPARPLKLVIPYAPGGATDIMGRAIAQRLSDVIGQAVVIDNRGGAGGNIGADFVAKSAPDGYTLVMGTIGTHAINPSLYPTMPFDPVRDFAPVTLALTNQLVLLVTPSLPVRSVRELVAASRAPGARFNFGSAGNGSSHHLAGEFLKLRAGVEMAHIPYKGSGPALTDLAAGNIQVLFGDIAGALPHIKTGRVVPLAVGGSQRSSLLPDLPTVAEATGLPGFDVSAWMGILAPAGTPPAIVAQLSTALNKVLGSTEIRERFASLGAEPVGSSPEAFADHIRSELRKWSELVSSSGVKLQ